MLRSALIAVVLFLGAGVRAQEACPVEVKLLLSPPTIQTVIASLDFKKQTAGRVYFFDTQALDLLNRGVIVRIRQGGSNDLTVKVRRPDANQRGDGSPLHDQFPCEIDRTQAGASTSYAVKRRYRAARVPDTGIDIYDLLNTSQKKLLQEAQISIDWARVKRIASINTTKWQNSAESLSGALALERWDWPKGSILELSARAAPAAGLSKYAELERLIRAKNLSLSNSQETKTSKVLQSLSNDR
jgi:hypothetical protein